ncbi:MAG: hypothetical protein GQ531_04900 [Sulfurovum sp.]|nr:hypothetical protein [Sulfurovum sp.]
MICCIDGCEETGEERKYFFKGMGLCIEHYAGYLVTIVDDFDTKVTVEKAESSFEKYKIVLKPIIPSPKPKPKPKSAVRSGMRM